MYILYKYNIRAVIGGCISPEIYQKVSKDFQSLDYEYGFKVNAFENIQEKLFEIIEGEEVEDVIDLNEKFLV